MRAVQITEFGGPEVLELTELPDPEPQPGARLVRVSRVGVNYGDTHLVENSYLAPAQLPLIPGGEIIGHTEDGRRVLALLPNGGYAELALAFPPATFDVPDGVSDGTALALAAQGMTAWHLLRTSSHLAAGESVVVHAAAGGVGTLAVQLAKLWGAGRVIATASSEGKRALALELGADVAIDASPENLTERLIEANGGKRVDIVLEMVGGEVFDASLAALDKFGRLVAYGAASRTPGRPVEPAKLMGRSQAVIGFWLTDCVGRGDMLQRSITDLFELTQRGDLKPLIGGEYAMSDVRKAHEDLRARRTTGKLVLDPSR